MKTASGPLASLITSGDFFSANLFEITSKLGPVLRYAATDFDARDENGNVYLSGRDGSGAPLIDPKSSRTTGRWTRGLDSDSWSVTLLPRTRDPYNPGVFTYPDVVGGTPWLAACRAGFFRSAAVVVRRAFWAAPPAVPFTTASTTCVGSLILFSGLIGGVEATQTATTFKINDYKVLLQQNMPRNVYQSSCRNILGDTRCGINLPSFAKTANAAAGSTPYAVQASPASPGGSGQWRLGIIKGTSGANSGYSRVIADWSAGTPQIFLPQIPFPFAVTAGDGFSFTPGCDRSMGAHGCAGFANLAKFRAESRTPAPEVQIG